MHDAYLTHAPACMACPQIMTRIGACCLITIGVWVVIELAVQFGHYRHRCKGGEGARVKGPPTATSACHSTTLGHNMAMHAAPLAGSGGL